jgi:methionyl-tRNA formyltransferase
VIGVFSLGMKGQAVVARLAERLTDQIDLFVVVGSDKAIQEDAAGETEAICGLHGIPCFTRSEWAMSPREADLYFAGGWRWMLADLQPLVVFHDSILPRFRGFAPLVNMLIRGEPRVGVTAILASDRYDEGDIIASRAVGVTYPCTIRDAISQVTPLYGDLAEETARNFIANGVITGTPQDHREATYSPWRDTDDYYLDFHWSAEKLARSCDALGWPYQGARARLADGVVRIEKAVALPDVVVEDRADHIGKVLFVTDGKPVVICGSGLLELHDIRDLAGTPLPPIGFRSRFLS